MTDATPAFWCGIAIGVGVLGAVIILSDTTPSDMKRHMQKEAVSHGNGRYIIDATNENPPVVRFEWITHTNK